MHASRVLPPADLAVFMISNPFADDQTLDAYVIPSVSDGPGWVGRDPRATLLVVITGVLIAVVLATILVAIVVAVGGKLP